MVFKKLRSSVALLTGAGCFATLAHANEVQLLTNKPMNITYRVAHQHPEAPPVLGPAQTIRVDNSVTIPTDLDGYEFAGIVPLVVDGHVLPPDANRFNQPNQCSMATDAKRPTGALEFKIEPKQATCSTHGGVFGSR